MPNRKKTGVEVLPVVDLSAESASLFLVGDATQVELHRGELDAQSSHVVRKS